MKQSDRFTQALAAKLLAHAVGHPATVQERVELDAIVEHNLSTGNRLVDLIEAICLSRSFAGPPEGPPEALTKSGIKQQPLASRAPGSRF